jgi:hypothetical protein
MSFQVLTPIDPVINRSKEFDSSDKYKNSIYEASSKEMNYFESSFSDYLNYNFNPDPPSTNESPGESGAYNSEESASDIVEEDKKIDDYQGDDSVTIEELDEI